MLSVQSNLLAMNAQRQFNINASQSAKTTEKLSSGYRINRAADDAAGLSISEKMRLQIRGLTQGENNIQDGISACQIMDGALNEVQEIMQRMNQLAVKAANGTLAPEDRQAIEEEMSQLRMELNMTSNSAKFNDIHLLTDGELKDDRGRKNGKADIVFLIDNTGSMGNHINNVANNLNDFVGVLDGRSVRYAVVSYGEVAEKEAVVSAFTESVSEAKGLILNVKENVAGGGDGPESALEGIVDALELVDKFGRKSAVTHMILVTDANFHDTGYTAAYEKVASGRYSTPEVVEMLEKSGVTFSTVTTGAWQNLYKDFTNGKMLNLGSATFGDDLKEIAEDIAEEAGKLDVLENGQIRIQCSAEAEDFINVHRYNINVNTLGLADISCLTMEDATAAIDTIGEGLKIVSGVRSQIGAEQNKLEHAQNNNANVAENTTAAESLIRDTDMAKEAVASSLQNILMQAGQAMMAQANQSNQGVLSLLQG